MSVSEKTSMKTPEKELSYVDKRLLIESFVLTSSVETLDNLTEVAKQVKWL